MRNTKSKEPAPSRACPELIEGSKGFTLIEMLVVIVIIGILATLVLVSVSGGRKKAQAVKAKTDMTELSKAFEMAASEGCRTIHFTAAGLLECASPTVKTFATLTSTSSGVTYTITLEKGAATVSGSTIGTPSDTDGSGINTGYNFTASGFSGDQTFTCNDGTLAGATRSGCFCSTEGGCTDIQ